MAPRNLIAVLDGSSQTVSSPTFMSGSLTEGTREGKSARKASKPSTEPEYSRTEEKINGWSHAIGAVLGAVALIALLVAASHNPSPAKFASVIIYGLSFIALYSVSAAYHFAKPGQVKRILRTFDHSTIYLLIAGSYTPFCLILLDKTPIGMIILVLQWTCAIIGIALNLWNMRSPVVKAVSMVMYVVMGWMVVVGLPSLLANITPQCLLWLVAGGISYTVGIVFYAMGSKRSYMHCIWHIFVLMGSALQLVSISMLM